MLYRIFTENKNNVDIQNIVSKYFPGFTLLSGVGFWEGEAESSLIIEIVSPHLEDSRKVDLIAKEIKLFNKQDSVLVQRINETSIFI